MKSNLSFCNCTFFPILEHCVVSSCFIVVVVVFTGERERKKILEGKITKKIGPAGVVLYIPYIIYIYILIYNISSSFVRKCMNLCAT